jgi:hypothetical protein
MSAFAVIFKEFPDILQPDPEVPVSPEDEMVKVCD